ncbi:MAG: PID-CTERM protein-sorting domain-containing protein [Bacteroidia bacterium]
MKKRILFLCLLILLILPLMAQPDNPGNPVPVDGGLGLLAAAGLAFAASRLNKRAKDQTGIEKEETKEE